MSAELVRLLRGDAAPAGRGVGVALRVAGGVCTAWNSTTKASTVVCGETTYTDLPVLNAAAMSTGAVLLGFGGRRPLILGRVDVP